ncbi:MAG: hypothetical protein K0S75_1480 [Clostridia bacterium]|jgi:hypothetical protein|nr:hypothetical protein [Herbinix sp.]MDF2592014.1 hypothetical protein [Clostridia bacterium]
MMKLYVTDKKGSILCEHTGEENVTLVYKNKYKKGDVLHFVPEKAGLYEVCFEDTIAPSIVYVESHASFTIPFGLMNRVCYSPRAFKSLQHLITAKEANPEFVRARRNLALNPFDGHNTSGMYPHASANVETRNESLFAARNAIDGIFANNAHYPYPFQSWGINKDPKAELTIEFGLPVNLDCIALTLRADYPHDSYWVKATLEFSDGSKEVFPLEKLATPQHIHIDKKDITWLVLKELMKAEDESPFPALTQIEAFGKISESTIKKDMV